MCGAFEPDAVSPNQLAPALRLRFELDTKISMALARESALGESRDAKTQEAALARLSDPRLNAGMARAVQSALRAQPDNLKLLRRWAQFERRAGHLARARDIYQRMAKLGLMSPTTLPDVHGVVPHGFGDERGYTPAPMYLVDEFMAEHIPRRCLAFARDQKAGFAAAGIDSRRRSYSADRRQTLVNWDVQSVARELEAELLQRLPRIRTSLGVPDFEVDSLETKMTNHIEGGYFRPHADNTSYFGPSGRVLTWLYYFHRQPKAFSGGRLLAFDTNFSTAHFDEAAFTTVEPQYNRLVVFPSCFYHCVTTTCLKSPGFMNGRFAISGHIHYTQPTP